MSKIEEVARAIAADRAEPWDDMREGERASWRETARAALLAIREPDEGMMQAAEREMYDLDLAGSGVWAERIFCRMIDHALTQETSE